MTKAEVQRKTKRNNTHSKIAADQWARQRQAVQPLDEAALIAIKTTFGVEGRIAVVSWAPHYAVSECARVFSNRPKLDAAGDVQEIKPTTEKSTGYQQVNIYSGERRRKNVRLHQLVAEVFWPNPQQLPLVLHRDGNPANNTATNLYWGSHADNVADARRHGTLPVGERHPATKATNMQIAAIRLCSQTGLPITGIAGEVGLGPKHALAVAAGRGWPSVPSGEQITAAVQKLIEEHNAAPATAA